MHAKLGDIVASRLRVPSEGGQAQTDVLVWGRITSINRFNPFFPAEAAQELANEGLSLLDTVLSNTRDQLEAQVLILGSTPDNSTGALAMSPLTYPVQPSSHVLRPPADAVLRLLTGDDLKKARLRIGTLIGRSDVPVSIAAREVVSRHLAILAMTGGGKTVAARRVLRELIKQRYPLIIFDPHGDYLGFYEQREHLGGADIKLFYPKIKVDDDARDTVADLIQKLGASITEAQMPFHRHVITHTQVAPNMTAAGFLEAVIDHARNILAKKTSGKKQKGHVPDDLESVRDSSMHVVIRNLTNVHTALKTMETNNERLRGRFPGFAFSEMPDPKHDPERIVYPNQVSIFYLAGYDHLAQSTIVSIVLENLFAHRAKLTNDIPPFQAVIEEAHNFIPSRTEGTDDTPSLATIRKVITEGRKFGTGLILISQRPARLDETTLAQCNSFLVLRLVNPRDKSFVRSVMENLSEADANILQTFGPGQGLVSGQAVRFPLLVKIDFDQDLISKAIGDEDFLEEASKWKKTGAQERKTENSRLAQDLDQIEKGIASGSTKPNVRRSPKSRKIRPKF
ncbi:MAG TPA: ATP-binding protein [Usitatibacter sp.]|nr:ATP-binding protein [Usitatibacter sp.]